MAEAKDEIAQWGGQLYFVYLPGTDLFTNAPGRQELRSGVFRAVDELQIPVIDVYQAFRQKPDPLRLFSLPFPHYSAAGYRLTAEVVLNALHSARRPSALTQRAHGESSGSSEAAVRKHE